MLTYSFVMQGMLLTQLGRFLRALVNESRKLSKTQKKAAVRSKGCISAPWGMWDTS